MSGKNPFRDPEVGLRPQTLAFSPSSELLASGGEDRAVKESAAWSVPCMLTSALCTLMSVLCTLTSVLCTCALGPLLLRIYRTPLSAISPSAPERTRAGLGSRDGGPPMHAHAALGGAGDPASHLPRRDVSA